jgi:hypothetical protein
MEERGFVRPARLLAIAAIAAGVCSASGRAASHTGPDIDQLLARIGARVSGYYSRAQTIVCIETSTVQPITPHWQFDGMARTVESELRFEAGTLSRDVRRINGRAPRERDKRDRAGCTDPTPLSPEPLAFLQADGVDDYQAVTVHDGRERDRAAVVIDFMSRIRRSRPVLIEDERGHDDCFDWSGPLATRRRVWIDAATDDVLRVDQRLEGPTDVQVPWAIQRRYLLTQWFTIDRDDVSTRYKAVKFSDPDETVMLPESIESLTVVRTQLQSTRRTATFSEYRRFLTKGRVRLP